MQFRVHLTPEWNIIEESYMETLVLAFENIVHI